MPADPVVRLLVCSECKSIEELPDFDGDPFYDEVLAVAVSRHQYPSGDKHIGQLFRVPEKDWHVMQVREQITAQIQQRMDPTAETGLGSAAYAMVDNFKADAMECFNRHFRNENCNDYKSPEKRLVPDTAEARRELGLAPASQYDSERNGTTRYLCEYCPVHSKVQEAQRKRAGLYD